MSVSSEPSIGDGSLLTMGFPGFANTVPDLNEPSHNRTSSIAIPTEDFGDNASTEVQAIVVRRDDSPTVTNRDSANNPVTTSTGMVVTSDESPTQQKFAASVATVGFEPTEFVTSESDSAEFMTVAFENWSVDDATLATPATLTVGAVASVETQLLLLASIQPRSAESSPSRSSR